MATWDVGVTVAHLTEDQSVWVRIPYVPPIYGTVVESGLLHRS